MPERRQSSLERMIGIISALAQIQQAKKQSAVQEETLKEQKAQFTARLGFDQKSEQSRKFEKLFDTFLNSSHEQREAADQIIDSMPGMDAQEKTAFRAFIRNAPETVASLRNTAATQGYRNPQANPMQQEAAMGATTGMNLGQAANSGLQKFLATGAQRQVTPFMQQEYAQRAAGNNTPVEANIQQRMLLDPQLMANLAQVTGGQRLSAAQQSQADVGMANVEVGREGVRQRGIEAENQIAAQLAAAFAKNQAGVAAISPSDLLQAHGLLSSAIKDVGNAALGSAVRRQAQAHYNQIASQFGLEPWDDAKQPTPAGTWEKLQAKVIPVQTPGVQPTTPTPPINNALTPWLRKQP